MHENGIKYQYLCHGAMMIIVSKEIPGLQMSYQKLISRIQQIKPLLQKSLPILWQPLFPMNLQDPTPQQKMLKIKTISTNKL